MASIFTAHVPVFHIICLLFLVNQSLGHVRLTFPHALQYDQDFLDNVRTRSPCGMPQGIVLGLLLFYNYIVEYTCTSLFDVHVLMIMKPGLVACPKFDESVCEIFLKIYNLTILFASLLS